MNTSRECFLLKEEDFLRGWSSDLRSLEETERVPGGASRFVSDERIVTIDADFCEPSEYGWLHHELRRLVVEAGLRSPLA